MTTFHFHCTRCAFARDLEYQPRAYALGDRELPMEQQHVWCARCQTVTPAEILARPELAHRTRGAHCLRCGNEDLALPGKPWADLRHTPCGGTLRCTATLVGGIFARCQPHLYSIDGELLRVGCRLGLFGGAPDTPLALW